MVKDYTIGIYIRLSMADEDTGNGNKAGKRQHRKSAYANQPLS